MLLLTADITRTTMIIHKSLLLFVQHSAMRCLSDVMEFFASVAGPGTKPMRTNDQSKIFSSTLTNSVVDSPTSKQHHCGTVPVYPVAVVLCSR